LPRVTCSGYSIVQPIGKATLSAHDALAAGRRGAEDKMKRTAVAVIALLMPAAAHADPLEPVNDVMNVAKQLWSGNAPDDLDYFDAERVSRDYSAALIDTYRQARKNPVFGLEPGQTEGSPFDYDIIANSQDGCPLEDIKTAVTGETEGVTTVTATFKLWACAEDAVERDSVNEVRFEVITENGRPVINDIKRMYEGEALSLMEEMSEIAKGAPEMMDAGPETEDGGETIDAGGDGEGAAQ
jgi:hypothetical protein